MTPTAAFAAVALVCWPVPEGRDCQRLEIAAASIADCRAKRREAASILRATGGDFLLGACARVYRQPEVAAERRDEQ